ncbi:hypothetical protein Ac2012v2_004654 [Leucoagaricus gongylophorus]
MRFTLVFLISLSFIVNASLIPDSRSVPVPAPTPIPISSGDFPLDVNRGELKGFPGKTSPLGSKRSRIENHRRQFHNADFASSGSPPSSDIDSAADADEARG